MWESSPPGPLLTGAILVEEPDPEGPTVFYARVSFAHRDDLQRQVQRLEALAREKGWADFDVVAEIASGVSGNRRRIPPDALRPQGEGDRDGTSGRERGGEPEALWSGHF